MATLWLHRVQLLLGPESPPEIGDALVASDGSLLALGSEAAQRAQDEGMEAVDGRGWTLAPVLVDPHSVLEDPWLGRAETLGSLAATAARGGYGTVALLPWSCPWRDRPERLTLQWPPPQQLLLWGSLSVDGAGQELAGHADQLAAGAVGLAAGADAPALSILERALLLGEAGQRPVLVPPRDHSLASGGFVREGVETLRAGWPADPPVSESLPLAGLLGLASAPGGDVLTLMNVATAAGVAALRQAARRPLATVSWWHLVADAGRLPPTAEGWRVEPSLGTPTDREALLAALSDGLITGVAVHHLPLDGEELMLPLDQRRAGVAGHGGRHGLVLPALWQELVVGRGWSVPRLWQVLSWGPAALLGQAAEQLLIGSRRWLLFDPHADQAMAPGDSRSLAANQPVPPGDWRGAVRATGLTAAEDWWLDPTPGEPGCLTD